MHLAPKSSVQTCKMQHKLAVEASLGLGKIACELNTLSQEGGLVPKYISSVHSSQRIKTHLLLSLIHISEPTRPY